MRFPFLATAPSTRAPLAAAAALALLALAPAAHADGLADLKGALQRLQGAAPVRGQAELRTAHRSGEGADATELRAQVAAGLEDGPRGLQVTYGRDLLSHVEEERRARAKDPQAKTPTVDALGSLQVTDLQPLATAAAGLMRTIDRSTFAGEQAQAWNGKPARKLTFTMPIESLSAKDRKYVKQFNAALDVWVAADGTPLASRLKEDVSGRAYVVVTFEVHNEENTTYGLAGDRLVTTRKEVHQVSSGMGDRDERQTTTTVQWAT